MTAHDDAMPDDITDAEAFHWDDGMEDYDDRRTGPRHGPRCSSDPEIGCVCGYAEWASEQDEAANAPVAP